MTTPTPPDQPVEPAAAAPTDATADIAPETAPETAAAPAAGPPPPPPGPPPPGPPLPPGQPLPPGYPPPYPFVATYREPWINPRKRGTAGLLAAVAALVLLGAGFIAGAAAFHDHNGRDRVIRPGYVMPGMGNGYGRNGMNKDRGPLGKLPGRWPGPLQPTSLPTTPAATPTS